MLSIFSPNQQHSYLCESIQNIYCKNGTKYKNLAKPTTLKYDWLQTLQFWQVWKIFAFFLLYIHLNVLFTWLLILCLLKVKIYICSDMTEILCLDIWNVFDVIWMLGNLYCSATCHFGASNYFFNFFLTLLNQVIFRSQTNFQTCQ